MAKVVNSINSVNLSSSFRTIVATCNYLGIQAVRLGYMWSNTATDPRCPDTLFCWMPKKHGKWNNQLNPTGTVWEEMPISPPNRQSVQDHLNEWLGKSHLKKVLFVKNKRFGDNDYHFIGVFVMDVQASKTAGHCVWKRIKSDTNLRHYEKSSPYK